jgi:hypothetical protein
MAAFLHESVHVAVLHYDRNIKLAWVRDPGMKRGKTR